MKTLETSPESTNDYLMVRDRSCVMRIDVQTSAWLASHSEFSAPVTQINASLLDVFKAYGGEVCISVIEDPETGDDRLVFEVRTRMDGREARSVMRRFVRESLPDDAVPLRDAMLFTVSPIGKIAA